jgi:hypothetical protein
MALGEALASHMLSFFCALQGSSSCQEAWISAEHSCVVHTLLLLHTLLVLHGYCMYLHAAQARCKCAWSRAYACTAERI